MPDQNINCVSCGTEFVHDEAEQEFWTKMNFQNPPKRCPTCRKKRRDNSARDTSDVRAVTDDYSKTWK